MWYSFLPWGVNRKIGVFYREEFDSKQMQQAAFGFVNGLSIEQVLLFYKEEFDNGKMYQARVGLQHGLTVEQVTSYYTDENTSRDMRDYRRKLEEEFGLYVEPKKEDLSGKISILKKLNLLEDE